MTVYHEDVISNHLTHTSPFLIQVKMGQHIKWMIRFTTQYESVRQPVGVSRGYTDHHQGRGIP